MYPKVVIGGVVALGFVLALQLVRRTGSSGEAPVDSYGNLKSVAYLPRATPEGTQNE